MFQDSSGNLKSVSAGESLATAEQLLSEATLGLSTTLSDIVKKITPDVLEKFAEAIKGSYSVYEKAITDIQTSFLAGGSALEKNIRTSIAGATSDIIKLGGTQADVVAMQKSVLTSLNTQFIPATEMLIVKNGQVITESSKIYPTLFSSAKLLQGTTEAGVVDTSKMINNFRTIGVNLYDIGEQTKTILKVVKDLGVTTQAVYGQLEKNFATMNTFNFEDGVEGMARMAANASVLRVDMGKTLSLAEDLLSPEKAIDTAATFQRMGVQVAELLDPMKLMDMSLNAPEQLMESLGKAAKEFVYLNEVSGRFEIRPGSQLVMREVAAAAKMSASEFAQFAIGVGELEEKLKRVPKSIGNTIISDKDQSLIANLGQLVDGRLMVTVPGQTELIDASLLTEKQLEEMKRADRDAGMTTIDLQKKSTTTLVEILRELVAIRQGTGAGIAASDKFFKDLPEEFKGLTSGMINKLNETIGEVVGDEKFDLRKMDSAYFVKNSDAMLESLGITAQNFKQGANILFEKIKEMGGYFGITDEKLKTYAKSIYDKLATYTTVDVEDALVMPSMNKIINYDVNDEMIFTQNKEKINAQLSPFETNVGNILESKVTGNVGFGGKIDFNITGLPTNLENSVELNKKISDVLMMVFEDPSIVPKIVSMISTRQQETTENNNRLYT